LTTVKSILLYFRKTDGSQELEIHADLVVGADGAYSVLRKAMLRKPMINFSQEYIEHGYMELAIPPNSQGKVIVNYAATYFSSYFPCACELFSAVSFANFRLLYSVSTL
jgi:2-polyprenyl-6-methoxyphenol hydroxylase-like FAD-dependent oxidoreductase